MVRYYGHDPVHQDRRHRVLSAFDDPAECAALLRRLQQDLAARRRAGMADRRERLDSAHLEPGHDGRIQEQRVARREFGR